MNDGPLRQHAALRRSAALRQHFGYGAARVALAPEPASGPRHVRPSVADAFSALADEVRAAGVVGSVRKTVTTVGTGLVAGLLVLLVFVMLSRDFADPDLEIVRFEPEPVPAPLESPPLPLAPPPEIPEPPPARPPPPPVVAETPPPPPPPLPAIPKAPPPPVVTRTPPPPMPAMPKAPPPPVEIATAAPPRPAPPAPAERPRPELRIDAVSKPPKTPAPAPSPVRATRPEPPRSKAVQPALSLDPVASEPFRVATSSRTSPAPRRPPAPRSRPAVAPSLAPSPVSAPEPAPNPARTTRTARSAPAPRAASRPPPGALPAFAAAPALAQARPRAPERSVRPAPVREPARGDSRHRDPGDDISGVALGTLAACVSDREEDRLKLAVMAAAGNRAECKSRAGRYRFVETKNLNAFLMWIERAPSSPPGDRCVELGLALECLQDRGRRGTDRT